MNLLMQIKKSIRVAAVVGVSIFWAAAVLSRLRIL